MPDPIDPDAPIDWSDSTVQAVAAAGLDSKRLVGDDELGQLEAVLERVNRIAHLSIDGRSERDQQLIEEAGDISIEIEARIGERDEAAS